MGFLGQFYCDEERLVVKDALCIQLYQDFDDRNPEPVAVLVPIGAQVNLNAVGAKKPLRPQYVSWDRREDPDSVSGRWQHAYGDSKAGGTPYYDDAIFDGERMLLQIAEIPVGFNFGGYAAIVVVTAEGAVVARLG
jgi:hypothetical protein